MFYSVQARRKIFLMLQIALTIAGLYHFAGLFYQVNDASVSQHATFVVVDFFCVYGFWKRSGYFIYFFAAFTMQQYYSHGQYLIHLWMSEDKIHWISIVVLALMPTGLFCLIAEWYLISREKNSLINNS